MKSQNFWLLCAISFGVLACGEVSVVSDPQVAQGNIETKGEFCTFDPLDKDAHTNYLFIMDYSASNGTTDRRRVRIDKAEEFYNKKRGQPSTRWSAISFSDDSEALVNDGNKENLIFVEDLAQSDQMMAAMKREPQNGSATNYAAPLDMATAAIEKFVKDGKKENDYFMIFFITDGEPNRGARSESELVSKVQKLVGVSPGRVYLSSVYYGGRGEPNKLRKMSEAGNGKFFQIDSAENLDFEDLITGPTRESWILKNDAFMVYNLNSAICEELNDRFGPDSDGDGVCDLDEKRYGLDPQLRSTPQKDQRGHWVDTGYSDFFHLLQIKGLVRLKECPVDKRKDEDLDLLNDCEEELIFNENPVGTEHKGKKRTRSDAKDPDTDGDGIIDGLDLQTFRSSWGFVLNNQVDKDWDREGISAFRQVQLHRNPLKPDQGSPEYDTQIRLREVRDGKSCYDFSQTQLQTYELLPVKDEDVHPLLRRSSDENKVLIYFVQTPFRDPSGKGIYMHSFQSVKTLDASGTLSGAAGLRIRNESFSPYETFRKLD
jgi:hypothetical protein